MLDFLQMAKNPSGHRFAENELLVVTYVASNGDTSLSDLIEFQNKLPKRGWGRSKSKQDWRALKRFFSWSVVTRSESGQSWTLREIIEKLLAERSSRNLTSDTFLRNLRKKLSSEPLDSCFGETVTLPETELGVRLCLRNTSEIRSLYTQSLDLCQSGRKLEFLCLEKRGRAVQEIRSVLEKMKRWRVYEFDGNDRDLESIANKIIDYFKNKSSELFSFYAVDPRLGDRKRIFIRTTFLKREIARELKVSEGEINLSTFQGIADQMKPFSEARNEFERFYIY
jgi:hypothetical protein